MSTQAAVAAKEPSVTVVINNREALDCNQLPHSGKDTAGVPQVGEILVLYPGVNLVPTEKLRTLRENQLFAQKFTTKIQRSAAPEQNAEKVGEFVLVAGKEVPAVMTLAKLSPQEAEEIVEETCMVNLLRKFESEEGRPEVRAKISNRIAVIEGGGAPYGAQ